MPDVLETGSVVAGYRIVRLLGRGATGAVYLAEDAERRQVALKVLIPELAQNARFRERFLRESQIAAGLDEPHIVPTIAVGSDDGTLFLAMRFVHGLDLRAILKREGPLAPEKNNTAGKNKGHGIEATTGSIDGGGNRASGNATPPQCVNVVCSG